MTIDELQVTYNFDGHNENKGLIGSQALTYTTKVVYSHQRHRFHLLIKLTIAKIAFSWDLHPHLIPLHESVSPKWHLDWFSHFCSRHPRDAHTDTQAARHTDHTHAMSRHA